MKHFPTWPALGTRSFRKRKASLISLILPLTPLCAQTTEWVFHKTSDGLHPDGNEQQMIWLMNRARANPAAEGEFLAATGDPSVVNAINFFKVSLPLVKSEFATLSAKPPAAFDRRLYEASKAHSLDLISRDAQDHEGQFERITAAGFSFSSGRVNVFSYAESSFHAHAGFNIDWGSGGTGGMQAGRGHRVAIMSDQSTFLSNVGIALVPDNLTDNDIGPLVLSAAYCSANSTAANHHNRFLLGTVWADANANNRYDPGEGRSNVRIQPATGAWHAITGIGGGYAIPITSPGSYAVTVSGGAVPAHINTTATVGSSSVLLDFRLSTAPFLLAITLAPNRIDLILEWSGGTPPYQIQRSPSLENASWQNIGSSTTATTATVPPSGSRSFYRVTGG
jgi:hypothetical protein